MKFQIEHTDTFGGEANYCWVNRKVIEYPVTISDLALVRRAKRFAGLQGVRCRVDDYGGDLAIWPIGICEVVFVSVEY